MTEVREGFRRAAIGLFGGLLGGVVGGALVTLVTVTLKSMFDFVSGESVAEIIGIPLLGLVLANVILHRIGGSDPGGSAWRTFTPGAARADITADVVDTAGVEERFPWRLAPLRTLAIVATVGFGAAMGLETPAAYIGVATGAWLGDRGRRWRELLRPAALAAGSAGVSALMGVALVGTAYMLELGRRHKAPLSAQRIVAAVTGGVIGWAITDAFGLHLIRLIVPQVPPADVLQAAKTAVFVGVISGGITALAGALLYRAKKWRASPVVRVALGGLATAVIAVALVIVAAPAAAVGAGGGAILWAEHVAPVPLTLLAVALLRALATIAAAATGGCGGVFVPFLAIGDIAGRVFAPWLGIETDLAAAAGAAAGIAGGYRLPVTAILMSLGIGGPLSATMTCVATAVIASVVGTGAGTAVDRITKLPYPWKRRGARSRP